MKRVSCSCSSSCFPCVGVRLVYWSLRSTATFVISFHRSLLLAFSLNFSSSFALLKSLFTQSSHLSCGLPRLLEPSCLFVSALFGSLSSFIRTMWPAHLLCEALITSHLRFSSNEVASHVKQLPFRPLLL